MSRWPGLLIGALLLANTSAGAVELRSKVFRDWIAGCDNLNQCVALSLPGENASPGIAYLKLERIGGALAAPTLTLNLREEKLKESFSAELTLDDVAFPTAGRTFKGSSMDGEVGEVGLPEAEITALLAAARKATKLAVRFEGKRFAVSLAGAVAAMIWIDEQQGRLGTVDALIRKGDAPATRVPPSRTMPVITARATAKLPKPDAKTAQAITGTVRDQVKAGGATDCDTSGPVREPDRIWPLDANRRLVALHCGTGAYNSATGYWIVTGNSGANAKPVTFPGEKGNILANAEYDPDKGQLSYYGKGRGVGDCGSAANYAWTGSAFVLTSLTRMEVCQGLPPDDWLSLFHSEVKVVK